MKISFVVPAYNEGQRLWSCLTAIAAEQNRYPLDTENIVVDNNSTDNTVDVANICGARVIKAKNQGIVWARQAGADVAQGEFIAFIDADCLMPKGWVRKALKAFSDPGVVAVSGPFVYHDLPRLTQTNTRVFYRLAWMSHQAMNMLQGGNFMVRKAALDAAGGFDTRAAFYGEDTFQAKRLGRQGKVKFDLKLSMESSGRRLSQEGVMTTGYKYIRSYIWAHLFDKPYTQAYDNHR